MLQVDKLTDQLPINSMYHPTTRLLTILELLQAHPLLSGAELAQRLEVQERTVRRYIMMLQDMGIPIETTRGPGGGYSLRPGFKLPPLLFTEEEATAIVLGLLGSAWLEVGQSAAAIEGALAKILRVLPLETRGQLDAFTTNVTFSPHEPTDHLDAALLLKLSDATQRKQSIHFTYRSHHDQVTQRTVEPYNISGWWGAWYLVGYCCLRQDYRLFRLDRMSEVQTLSETFVRDKAFDGQAYVIDQLAKASDGWPIEVIFAAPLYTVQQKISTNFGILTETPSGVLFQCEHRDLGEVARYLVGLDLPFRVCKPSELRQALRQLAERIVQSATT